MVRCEINDRFFEEREEWDFSPAYAISMAPVAQRTTNQIKPARPSACFRREEHREADIGHGSGCRHDDHHFPPGLGSRREQSLGGDGRGARQIASVTRRQLPAQCPPSSRTNPGCWFAGNTRAAPGEPPAGSAVRRFRRSPGRRFNVAFPCAHGTRDGVLALESRRSIRRPSGPECTNAPRSDPRLWASARRAAGAGGGASSSCPVVRVCHQAPSTAPVPAAPS